MTAAARYLRLYGHFLRFSFSRAMQFRLDFLFRTIMDIVFYAVQLGFFAVLYRHTPMFAGWNEAQIYVFSATYFVVDAIHMTVFSTNMWFLPVSINKGELDYYLVRPVSSLFFLSLREFAANSFLNLLIALGILAWALWRYPGDLPAANLLAFAAMIPVGTLIFYLVQMVFLIPTFWLQSGRGLFTLHMSLSNFSSRPDAMYGAWLRRLLLSVIPFAFVAAVPARVLFDGPSWGLLAHVTVVTAGFFALVLWMWDRGLNAYGSASS